MYVQGIFNMYGYGCPRNYDQALQLFERTISASAVSGDVYYSAKATHAAGEIRALLSIAQQRTDAVMDAMRGRAADRGGDLT